MRTDHFFRANRELLRQHIMSMPDSQLIWRTESRLAEDQVAERLWYDAQNKLLGREVNTYDAVGNLKLSRLTSPDEIPLRIWERSSPDLSDWSVKNFDQKGVWRVYEVHSRDPFYRRYFLSAAGEIQRGEVRTAEDRLIWYYTESAPVEGAVLVKIYSGTGQLLLQTQRPKKGYIILTPDSIPRQIASIWSDGGLFQLEQQALTDSTRLLTWRTVEGDLVLRKRQFNQRTNLPVEEIFFYSTGPRQPMVWYLFDDNGRVRQITSYSPDGSAVWILNFERDPDGRALVATLQNSENEVHETTLYHYTVDGELAFVERRGPFGKLKGSTQYFTDAPVELIRERNAMGTISQDVTRNLVGDTLRRATYRKLDFIWVGMYYDDQGRLTAQKRLTPDELSGQTVYFNSEGRRIAEEYLGKGEAVFQRVRYIDSPRPLRLRENFSRDGELVNLDSVYLRADGQELRMISRDEFGKVRVSEQYEYEQDTLRVKVRRNAKNAIMTKTFFHYDSVGNLAATVIEDTTGGWLGGTRLRYDNHGRLIREQMLGMAKEVLEDHRYHYNSQGQLYREQILQQEALIETVEYTYLPDYALRVAVHYSPAGDVIRREIEDIVAGDR